MINTVLESLSGLNVGRAPDREIGMCFYASVGHMLGATIEQVKEIRAEGLEIMSKMSESYVRKLGYLGTEVQQRMSALGLSSSLTRSRAPVGNRLFSHWGCDMDMTAIALHLGYLVIIVSQSSTIVYPPNTSSMSLCQLPTKCPSMFQVDENPYCIILACLGNVHFEPTTPMNATRRFVYKQDKLPRLLDLNIPAPPAAAVPIAL